MMWSLTEWRIVRKALGKGPLRMDTRQWIGAVVEEEIADIEPQILIIFIAPECKIF
jgi:hypothetical protein